MKRFNEDWPSKQAFDFFLVVPVVDYPNEFDMSPPIFVMAAINAEAAVEGVRNCLRMGIILPGALTSKIFNNYPIHSTDRTIPDFLLGAPRFDVEKFIPEAKAGKSWRRAISQIVKDIRNWWAR